MNEWTHDELCERAKRWLSGTRQCNPVFSNIASCSEIPDAIGWSSRFAWEGSTVVECKTSRADFHADRRKYQMYEHEERKWRFPVSRISPKHADFQKYRLIDVPRMGNFRFFLCEPGVITVDLVEKYCPDHGLANVVGRMVKVVKTAPRRVVDTIDKDAEIRYLRFAIINNKTPHVGTLDFESESEIARIEEGR